MRSLFSHFLKQDSRTGSVWASFALYLIATVYLCYLLFQSQNNIQVWSGLFWLVTLFTLTNSLAKPFIKKDQRMVLYSLVGPRQFILARFLYHLFVGMVLVLMAFGCFKLFLPVESTEAHQGLFLLVMLLGTLALSSVMTLVGALLNHTSGGTGFGVVLSFPLLIPSLLLIVENTQLVLVGGTFSELQGGLGLLLALVVICFALLLVLFPYLWRR